MPRSTAPWRRTVPALALAAAVAAGLVSGCGGNDGKDRFAKAFKPVNAQIVALGADVGQTLQNTARATDEERARTFIGYVPRLQALKRRVDGLDPPSDLRPQVRRLSGAMTRLVVDLGGLGVAAKAHDKQRFSAAAAALLRDSPPLVEARRTLARKTGAPANP